MSVLLNVGAITDIASVREDILQYKVRRGEERVRHGTAIFGKFVYRDETHITLVHEESKIPDITYKRVGEMGKGGFGLVYAYEIRPPPTGVPDIFPRFLAVKFPRNPANSDVPYECEIIRQFKRTGVNLIHRLNASPLFGDGNIEIGVVMEHCDGSLRRIQDRNVMPPFNWIQNLVNGLLIDSADIAKKTGLFHVDMKLDNVFHTTDGDPGRHGYFLIGDLGGFQSVSAKSSHGTYRKFGVRTNGFEHLCFCIGLMVVFILLGESDKNGAPNRSAFMNWLARNHEGGQMSNVDWIRANGGFDMMNIWGEFRDSGGVPPKRSRGPMRDWEVGQSRDGRPITNGLKNHILQYSKDRGYAPLDAHRACELVEKLSFPQDYEIHGFQDIHKFFDFTIERRREPTFDTTGMGLGPARR